mmetsp:Transcript_103492/g.221284  ORF Transcript_103492/g.221284 Transcript_103492/m.221284 type:complete len:239 (-) Transcript_103492:28-744(-)
MRLWLRDRTSSARWRRLARVRSGSRCCRARRRMPLLPTVALCLAPRHASPSPELTRWGTASAVRAVAAGWAPPTPLPAGPSSGSSSSTARTSVAMVRSALHSRKVLMLLSLGRLWGEPSHTTRNSIVLCMPCVDKRRLRETSLPEQSLLSLFSVLSSMMMAAQRAVGRNGYSSFVWRKITIANLSTTRITGSLLGWGTTPGIGCKVGALIRRSSIYSTTLGSLCLLVMWILLRRGPRG